MSTQGYSVLLLRRGQAKIGQFIVKFRLCNQGCFLSDCTHQELRHTVARSKAHTQRKKLFHRAVKSKLYLAGVIILHAPVREREGTMVKF